MTMTPEAKQALSKTIRAQREKLLSELHDEVERAYQLGVRTQDSTLSARQRALRARLKAWASEQVRAQAKKGSGKGGRDEAAFVREAEKVAAYTLLNRVVLLRLMEGGAMPLRKLAVVTGGYKARGYKELRELCAQLVRAEQTEGYGFLLQLVFEELALELPGLFGAGGVAELVPVPPSTLRGLIEALDAPELASCWDDDMTLGWVYQYWNDPEREALDKKLNDGGKVEPHEIASKTQLFTERYMVDWLLQNTLGPLWLSICHVNDWTPQVVEDGTLERLEARRADWRVRRDAGEVELTELMPLETDAERRWAYYVTQPLTPAQIEAAPGSVSEIKLIDPAMGSGHFLMVAFELLSALYREEAAHRGEEFDAAQAAQSILECNLHGVDLDERAVQIAAAGLWLKAKQLAPSAQPAQLNLVAANLRLGNLSDEDEALVELRAGLEAEVGLPPSLTNALIRALRGADHLGSLLKLGTAIDEALQAAEDELGKLAIPQGDLFSGYSPTRAKLTLDEARALTLKRLESFLVRHTAADELGLRLRGQQLARGVLLVRLLEESQYHLVVGNPPYQGTSKMADTAYITKHYPRGKADLYAAFLERGLLLARDGGVSALLTMRNWMFIKQYADLRKWLLENFDLKYLMDLSSGAFEEISAAQVVVSVSAGVFVKGKTEDLKSVAFKPFDDATLTSIGETNRKRAATLAHVGRYDFEPAALKVVPEWPLVYWWDKGFLKKYKKSEKVGPKTKIGIQTGDNERFLRTCSEILNFEASRNFDHFNKLNIKKWVPYIKGANGQTWIEPLNKIINWRLIGVELFSHPSARYGRGSEKYFYRGVAFTTIGAEFGGRAHRFPSIIGDTGASVYDAKWKDILCIFNSKKGKDFLSSVNPTIHFTSGDVKRMFFEDFNHSADIFATIEHAFDVHEAHREASVEFKQPGPSPWRYAQAWAQRAVDREEGEDLPEYVEELDAEPATDHVSYALGVALGRFGGEGEGILDPADAAAMAGTLPNGVLFLDGTLGDDDLSDGLGHPACALLRETWEAHGAEVGKGELRGYLRDEFFKGVHRQMYENRPIHWPLSSEKRTFVAWVNIHRMGEATLKNLLADHLIPAKTRLEGQRADARAARDGADKKSAKAAEKRAERLSAAVEELERFICDVDQCAFRGPQPPNAKTRAREQDAAYAPDLDDGVMINSAALWPLLKPQWKDPEKWWGELANASGKKDYDWARLAMRYWPTRVDTKCKVDPSLGVAHGCFWRYHPARAWAWELRLQDEIEQSFRIEEPPYQPGGREVGDAGDGMHRAKFLTEQPAEAISAIRTEAIRRMGRGAKAKLVPEMTIIEDGLWRAHPQELWDMELELAERQGAEFILRSPDEPAARAAFQTANPTLVAARSLLLADLQPRLDLSGGEEDDVGADEEVGDEEV